MTKILFNLSLEILKIDLGNFVSEIRFRKRNIGKFFTKSSIKKVSFLQNYWMNETSKEFLKIYIKNIIKVKLNTRDNIFTVSLSNDKINCKLKIK